MQALQIITSELTLPGHRSNASITSCLKSETCQELRAAAGCITLGK